MEKLVFFAICEDSRFQADWDPFWAAVTAAVKRNNVSFVGGDFNMALFQGQSMLREGGVDATFLGSYAWLHTDTRGGGAGTGTLQQCRFDSLGLFAVCPVSTVSRLFGPNEVRSGQGMREFGDGQGYPHHSYVGGLDAVIEAFKLTRGSGERAHALPHIKQKALNPDVWDAPGRLFVGGGHMPLLFYVGDRSLRTTERLEAREQDMIERGWGPASNNRSRHMGREQGKGKGKDKGQDKGKDKGNGKGQK